MKPKYRVFDVGWPHKWSTARQFVVAIAGVMLALVIRLALDPILGDRVPFIAVYTALLPLALLVRTVPFVTAATLGGLGAVFLFIQPRHTLHVDGAVALQLVLFGIAAGVSALTASISRRAQARIRSADAMLKAFVDDSPTCKWITDDRDRIVYVNNAMAGVLGRRPEEVVGQTHADILPAGVAASAVDRIRQVRATGEPTVSVETIQQPGAHESRVLEWRRFRLHAGSSAGVLVAGMANDVTERLAMEQALREADRRKNEFLATLSHEMRNILGPIRNAVSLMDARPAQDPQDRWTRDLIDRQVRHMARLLDDLSDMSRVSHGKLMIQKELVDLASVIRAAVDTNRTAITDARHTLDVVLPAEPVHVEADPQRMSQVFSNLLLNATKYTNPGGHIQLVAKREGRDVVVSVCDNGIGIPSDAMPHIFDLFAQAQPAVARSQGGLGIGLSLVRSLVELHGGSVSVRSEGPGKGSDFSVRLPVAPSPPSAA